MGATDVCDALDNDCDGSPGADEEDADGDGSPVCGGDCDDNDDQRFPGAGEICDAIDNDCDSLVDLNDPDYQDDYDGDLDEAILCGGTDCDDMDADYEGLDLDGDGVSTCGPDAVAGTTDDDCDDDNADVYPGADEWCDLVDNDCDTYVDAVDPDFQLDYDGDGYDALDCGGTDCNDDNAHAFPEAVTTSGWNRECDIWLASDTEDTEWYSHRLDQANFAYDGSRLAMYFRSGYWQYEMEFGVYYSDDNGASWTLEGPIFDGTGDPVNQWDGWGVSTPNVIYDANDATWPYKMYYSALALYWDSRYHIGMAVSSDGINWTRWDDDGDGTADRVVPAGDVGDADADSAFNPYVWVDGTTYYMVYAGYSGFNAGLFLAYSTDMGYTWTKWDSAVGSGDDPERILQPSGAGFDAMALGFPMMMENDGTDVLVYTGMDVTFVWSDCGAATVPFGIENGLERVGDINPVFEPALTAGRWDDGTVYASDWVEDGGVHYYYYTGAYTDAGFDGSTVSSIGRVSNTAPTLTLSSPSENDSFALTDDIDVSGTVSDSQSLDELYVTVGSSLDGAIVGSGFADAVGNYDITLGAGTLGAGSHELVVTVFDAGGLLSADTVNVVVF